MGNRYEPCAYQEVNNNYRARKTMKIIERKIGQPNTNDANKFDLRIFNKLIC